MFWRLLPAIILALIGIVLIGLFTRHLFSSLVGDPRQLRDRILFRRKRGMLDEIDIALKTNDLPKARDLLANAFFLDPAVADKQLLENIAQHHLDVLNRFLNLSDQLSNRFAGLPVLEDLLQSRLELLKARFDITQTKRGLRQRKLVSGHRTPDWAIQEFGKKLLEINDRLSTNRNSIDAQVRDILKSIHEPAEPDNVTYH